MYKQILVDKTLFKKIVVFLSKQRFQIVFFLFFIPSRQPEVLMLKYKNINLNLNPSVSVFILLSHITAAGKLFSSRFVADSKSGRL